MNIKWIPKLVIWHINLTLTLARSDIVYAGGMASKPILLMTDRDLLEFNICRFMKKDFEKEIFLVSSNFFAWILISKIDVKVNLRIITKYHEADSKIGFLTKSISKPYGRATAMPPAWELNYKEFIMVFFSFSRFFFLKIEIITVNTSLHI